MRVIGGKYKGRKLKVPAGKHTRPTSDKTREGIFNILAHSINWKGFYDARVLDVFCGSGSLGLEAISRGAKKSVFIDNDRTSIQCIKANAKMLGEIQNITPLELDATRLFSPPRIANAPLDLAFLDAPYGSKKTNIALSNLCENGWITENGLLVVETGKNDELVLAGDLKVLDERIYGTTKIIFLQFKEHHER